MSRILLAQSGPNKIIENGIRDLDDVTFSEKIKNMALEIYKKYTGQKVHGFINEKRTAAASIYLALKIHPDTTISPTEIGSVRYIKEPNKVYKKSKKIKNELGISVEFAETPEEYIKKGCSELDMDQEFIECSLSVLKTLRCNGYKKIESGKSRRAIAASVIYITGIIENVGLNQCEISNVLNLSESTLRLRYKEQLDCLSDIDCNCSNSNTHWKETIGKCQQE